jgi:hypothetical protein
MGSLLQLAYDLHRHFLVGWSLARWLGVLLFCAGLAILIDRRAFTWQVILVATLLLSHILVQFWAGRKGFLHFRASSHAEAIVRQAQMEPSLQPEELVPVRVAGLFAVEGKEQYYVDLDAGCAAGREGRAGTHGPLIGACCVLRVA